MSGSLVVASIHCDRLTVTGRLDWRRTRRKGGESYYDSDTLRELFNPMNYKISCYPNSDSRLYSDNFRISIESEGSSIFIQANRRHSSYNRDFRVDFNPSKLNDAERDWLLNILKRIKEKKATRIDIAVNFHHDLTNFKLLDGRLRSSVEYKDKYDNIETVYKGSMSGESYLKMYNKKIEQQSKYKEVDHEWWRIEETIKSRKAHDYKNHEWFKDVQLTTDKPLFSDDIKPTDQAAALAVLNNLMTLDDFSKNYRTKLRKIIDSATYEGGFSLHEAIKKAPYQQMISGALADIACYMD